MHLGTLYNIKKYFNDNENHYKVDIHFCLNHKTTEIFLE